MLPCFSFSSLSNMFYNHFFQRLLKCPKYAQSGIQKHRFISAFDIYFYFKPTQMGTQFQSIRDSTFCLWWSHIRVQKCSKEHLVPGDSSTVITALWQSHISIHCGASHPHRFPISFLALESMAFPGALLGTCKVCSLKCRKLFLILRST